MKGVVYIIIGALAVDAAFGGGGGEESMSGAMARISHAPYGRALLVLIAAGFLGYAVWRIVEAWTDPEARGDDAKGLTIRASQLVRGLIYLALTAEAVRMAINPFGQQSAGGDQGTQHWTAKLIGSPAGKWLAIAIGIGVVIYGLVALWRAWAARLTKELALTGLGARARRWVIGVARFGIAARGVVFGIVGVSLVRAGWNANPSQAHGTAGSLRTLSAGGQWLLAVVAFGLIAYGLYQFVKSRYRRVDVG